MIPNIGTDPFHLYGSAFTFPSVYTYARVVYALSEEKRKSSIKRSSIFQYYHCKLIFSLFTGELFNMEEDTITLDRNNTDSSENSSKTEKKKKLKKRTINLQRSEASENISEFNLNEVGKETVKLNELIKTSKKLSGAGLVTKQLGKVKKLHSLSVPLSKPQMTKIKRSIGYEKAVEEFDKWDPIVKSNRSAHQTIYPLKKPEIQLQSFEKATEQFVTKHPVEIAVEELLRKSKNVLKKDKTLTEAEEKALKAMSLEEAKLRHNELMKHRALISYKEAKARRQNKIKSKRYHRILKKEKVKKFMEEFENLQQQDAVAALEKLMEADKLRVLERTTLKHRNTGKWSKVQQLRAKYNPEARSNLKEVLVIGRKLREKVPTIQNAINRLTSDLESQLVEETDDSICNKGLIEETNENTSNDETDKVPFKDQSDEPVTNEISNEYAKENSFLEKFSLVKHLQQAENTKRMKRTGSSQKVVVSDVSDMDFSKMSELDSFKPSCVDFGDIMDDIEENDDVENGESEGMNMSEAMDDENIIEEFKEEKRAAEDKRPKGLNLFLPGWGSWVGKGIRQSKSKKRRFLIKLPEEPAPKKNTLGNVIINEDGDKKASAYQVKQLPFPFSNVTQFERHIQQPVSHTWVPPSSLRNLTAPKTVTKAGKIIEPIDAEDVVLEKTTKTPRQQKKKKKSNNDPQAF